MQVLRDTNERVIELIRDKNFKPAAAGLDRIVNGIIAFLNAGADLRSHACFFMWAEAELVAFGMDAPESTCKSAAIPLLEDARDLAKSENARSNISNFIRALKSRDSLSVIKSKIDPEFPHSVVDILTDLQGRLRL